MIIGAFISFNVVSSGENFKTLQDEIENSTNTIELTRDYKYDNSTDHELNKGILINKSNITINGNGHTIDCSNQSRVFNITGENVTITNLNFINGNAGEENGGAIYENSSMKLENLTFSNNLANSGGAIFHDENNATTNITNCTFDGDSAGKGGSIYTCKELNIHDSKFINSKADSGSAIYAQADMDIKNSTFKDMTAKENGGAIFTSNITGISDCLFTNTNAQWGGGIYSYKELEVNNSTFINSNAKYSAAIYAQGNITIEDSLFKNLHANETAGAIGLREVKTGNITNCTFANTLAKNDGGAIDIDGNIDPTIEVYIENSEFFNTHANYGAALVQTSGSLTIENTLFKNNIATGDGAAVYTSFVENFNMSNCTFESNKIIMQDLYNGGAVYCDMTNLTSISSTFADNSKNAIYAYDSNLNISDANFNNNHEAIHCMFSENTLKNNTYHDDTLVLNDTNYDSIMQEDCANLKLTNKTINTDSLPSRFDMRETGWVTPVRIQGDANTCWAFGACGALESALLKATGHEYDFSEGHMVNTMLQNSKYGISEDADDGGYSDWALEYVLSWVGPIPQKIDPYDEMGRLSPILETDKNIHIQDAIFIGSRESLTDNDKYKTALMEYGALDASYTNFESAPYYNNKTAAQYQNISHKQDHEITLIGWDDNYSASNFIITPPGDGAWIYKNSWNTSWGEEGYGYVSYYDVGLFNSNYTVGYVIENTEDYTKNYQTDLSGNLTIDEYNANISYSNNYTSIGDELISGVGTYFIEEGENYSLEIYVNGELKHVQNGTAPFYGYHTVKLNKEIPVKEGNDFKVVMKKKSLPKLSYSRQHYAENITFVNYGDGWEDISLENETVSLKVYTKNPPSPLENFFNI